MPEITFAEMPPVRSRRRGQVTVDGSDFVIRAPYDPEQLEAIRALPDRRWDNAGKVWRVGSKSATRVRALASHFGWDMDGEQPAAESLVTIDMRGSLLYVRFKYLPALALRVRNVPGAHYSAGEKAWAVPIESVESLHVALKDVRVDGPSFVELADRARAAMRLVAMSSAIDADIEPIPGLQATLANFQRAAVAYALETRRTFISLSTGLGKSVCALATLEAADGYPAALIVPATLKVNWQREVAKFLPGRKVVVVNGMIRRERARTLALVAKAHAKARAGEHGDSHGSDGALALNGCPLCAGLAPDAQDLAHADLVVINYDLIRPDSETKREGWTSVLAGLGLRGLVTDESHYSKDPNSLRTKACVEISRSMPADAVRLALTATPVMNQRSELASQLEVLGRLDEFGTAHAISTMSDINTRARARCLYRVTHETVGLEVPCDQPTVIVEGDPQAMAEYRKAEKDLLNYLAEKAARIAASNGLDPADAAVTAKMRAAAAEALVRITTCKRLAARAKIPAAKAWIGDYLEENPGSKLLVFAHHTDVLQAVAEPFGASILAGGLTSEAKMGMVDAFQDNESVRLLVCGITAAGVGLTLTKARDVLFIEQAWSPATHRQCSARTFGRLNDLHGGSSTMMLAADTIDETIAALLEMKQAEIDDATDGSDDPEGRTSVLADLVTSLTTRGQR